MTDLSPAAAAVLDAFDSKWADTRHQALIAALRAVADQVVPAPLVTPGGSKIWPSEPELSIRESLLAIAAELENTSSYCQPDDQ